MTRFIPLERRPGKGAVPATAILFAAMGAIVAASQPARAEPVVKMNATIIALYDDGLLVMAGTASHLGEFSGFAEIDFLPGAIDSTLEGSGVAVLKAATGDVLVGIVDWLVDPEGPGVIAFSWRDDVTLRDGTTVATTGRFVGNRPGGTESDTQRTDTDREGTRLDRDIKAREFKNLLNELRLTCDSITDPDTLAVCENGELLLLEDIHEATQ